MAGTGGYRPNAGRKKGARNKITAQVIEAAQQTGLLPHQILLQISQTGTIEHHGRLVMVDLEMRVDCLKTAAAYFAPKLANIEQKIESSVNYVISGEPLTQEQFEQKYAIDSVGTAATTKVVD